MIRPIIEHSLCVFYMEFFSQEHPLPNSVNFRTGTRNIGKKETSEPHYMRSTIATIDALLKYLTISFSQV